MTCFPWFRMPSRSSWSSSLRQFVQRHLICGRPQLIILLQETLYRYTLEESVRLDSERDSQRVGLLHRHPLPSNPSLANSYSHVLFRVSSPNRAAPPLLFARMRPNFPGSAGSSAISLRHSARLCMESSWGPAAVSHAFGRRALAHARRRADESLGNVNSFLQIRIRGLPLTLARVPSCVADERFPFSADSEIKLLGIRCSCRFFSPSSSASQLDLTLSLSRGLKTTTTTGSHVRRTSRQRRLGGSRRLDEGRVDEVFGSI
jgi:hypothetical protein